MKKIDKGLIKKNSDQYRLPPDPDSLRVHGAVPGVLGRFHFTAHF